MKLIIRDINSKLTLNNNKYIQLDAGIDAEILVIAGGGAGGTGAHQISPTDIYTGGGGGGAGQYIYYSTYNLPSYFNVIIGDGGVWNTSPIGGNTIVHDIISHGGGSGQGSTSIDPQYGVDGGSGGGARGADADPYTGGKAIYGLYGNDGGSTTTNPNGAGGGGAGGVGAENRTAGLYLTNNITGNNVNYCRGGVGATTSTTPSGVASNRGYGGNGAKSGTAGGTGGSGVFILKYLGATKASGGNITSNGGYTIHTFTSNGEFRLI